MKAILVEDHPEIREELEKMIITHCGDVHLMGTAANVVSGAKLVRETDPDLLFLDIELPDGTAFDLLDIIQRPVKVIFITGSDAYAIRAFRYAALDYLLKPVEPKELIEAVQRAQQTSDPDNQRIALYKSFVQEQGRVPSRIALHTADKILFIDIPDIIRCMADGNYTKFYLSGGSSVLVARTLKDYDKLLSEASFVRVHQSHLVNMQHIREYVKSDGGYIVMDDGSKIPVSTRKKAEVLELFDQMRGK